MEYEELQINKSLLVSP